MTQLFGPSYEKNLIINNRELKHKGIFKVDDLFSTINKAIDSKGYTKREKRSEESVSEEGKNTYVELRPYKEKGNFTVLAIKIKISLDNVTETTKDVDGMKKFQQGDLKIVFDSWVLTDYEDSWGMKPLVYFLKGVINKYIYTWPLEAGYPGELAGDTAYIYAQVKKLLNSYGKSEAKVTKEEEIMAEVAKDIQNRM